MAPDAPCERRQAIGSKRFAVSQHDGTETRASASSFPSCRKKDADFVYSAEALATAVRLCARVPHNQFVLVWDA
ncbi:MAG: hypothetical protein EAZ24_03995 [Burkholderiales bacterium]|nr:MAG: hypothetical protein EAZ24_03995 [Burkholderiales bacterium]TAG83218.1 MAG: hypothetical protein EAZ21_01970 [Betaproteobacteria bacterium]